MKQVEVLDKSVSLEEIDELIRTGRVVTLPYALNRSVYIIQNHHPQQVMVTDISVKAVQLNGSWIDWETLERSGGIYGSEFEALSAIAEKGL